MAGGGTEKCLKEKWVILRDEAVMPSEREGYKKDTYCIPNKNFHCNSDDVFC